LEGVDDIYKQFTEYGYYGQKYMELCNGGILDEITKEAGAVATAEAKDFL